MTRRAAPLVLFIPLIVCVSSVAAQEPRRDYRRAYAVVDELVKLNGLDEEYRTLKATLAGYGVGPKQFAQVYNRRLNRSNSLHGDPAGLMSAADEMTAALNAAAAERDLVGAYMVLLEQLKLDVARPEAPAAKTGTEVVRAILRALKTEAEETPAALFHAEAAKAIYKMEAPTAADVTARLKHDAKVQMCDRLLPLFNVLVIKDGQATLDENSIRLCAYAQAVNWPRLYAAAGPVVALTDAAYLARLKQVVEALEAKKPREAVLYEKQTDWGRIVFGGSVENRHEITDQAVIVDLGGNDTYVLGGDAEPPVLIIDFAGDDTYRAERDLGFACGRLGTSVLVDVEGNDTYETVGYALGFGLFGVGILADYAGDDTYTSAGGFVQGASAFGVGLLVEGGGRDTYKAHVYAQGFALCDAAAALVELGGDDTYEAGGKYLSSNHREENDESFRSWSMGFGMGLRGLATGGIGILSDAAGDDRYLGDTFSVASSYFYGLGVLVDRGGNDRYRAFRYGIGAGIHTGNGVLLDEAGDDVYELLFGVGIGCGHDLSTGLVYDAAGDDRYVNSRYHNLEQDKYNKQEGVVRAFGNNLSMGAGNAHAIGILIDERGDDRYVCHDARGQGFSPPFDEKLSQFGVLVDGGGTDYYSLLHENNSRWTNKDSKKDAAAGGMGVDYEAASAPTLPGPAARKAYVWDLGSTGEIASFRDMIDISLEKNVLAMTANADGASFSPTLYGPIPAEYDKMIVRIWASEETALTVRFASPGGVGGVSAAAQVKAGVNELKLDLGRAKFARTDQAGEVRWGGPSKQIESLTFVPADRGGVRVKVRSVVLFK